MAKVEFHPDLTKYRKNGFYETLELEENEREKEKFIKVLEGMIRTSLEYRNYIRYLKTEAQLNYCTMFNILPEEIVSLVSIEMHHFPLTLYDIVEVVLDKYLTSKKAFTRLTICNEVMEAHYFNKVGIIPLTVSAHQLAHSGTRFLTRSEVFGNVESFCEQYEIFMTDSAKNKVSIMNSTTKELQNATINSFFEFNPDLFKEFDAIDYDNVNLPNEE